MADRFDIRPLAEGEPRSRGAIPRRTRLRITPPASTEAVGGDVPYDTAAHVAHGGHNHSGPIDMPEEAKRRVRRILAAIVIPLIVATLVGLVMLWPGGVSTTSSYAPVAGEDHVVTVLGDLSQCHTDGLSDDQLATVVCVRSDEPIGGVSTPTLAHIPPEVRPSLHTGARIHVLSVTDSQETGAPLVYVDGERTTPLLALAIVYLVVVLAVALKRGLLAMVGLGMSVATIIFFLVPALMKGESPLLVTLVAVSTMIVASVYVAHGVSIKSTTALLGTYIGLALTTVGALWATRSMLLIGSGDDIQNVYATLPNVSLPAVMTCGIVIAGIGALNDVTITQASAVWELYELNPTTGVWDVFRSAMRIGRDHIASTVYTLAFAYAGTALPLLMLVLMIDRPVIGIITSGQIAEELARTLVASIGLVVAIPLTTLIGALLVPAARRAPRQATESDKA